MEERIYQGYVYRRAGPNEAWQMVGPAQQAPQAAPAPQSGRVIADPYRPREEERKERQDQRSEQDQEFERRRLEMERERIEMAKRQADWDMQQAQEKAARDAREGGTDPDSLGRINSLVNQINTVSDLFAKGPAQTEGLAGIKDWLPGQDASAFDSAASSLEDIAIGAFKIPGMGAQSDADAARMAAAVKPSRYALDSGTVQQLNDVRSRVDEWYKARGMPLPSWSASVPGATQSSPQQVQQRAAQMIKQGASEQDVRAYLNTAIPGSGDAATGLSEAMAFARANPGSTPMVDVQEPVAPASPPADNGTYQDSILGQGMSGVNEGIAGLLGLPVDAATFAMNLVPQGINAIANTDIPHIENPVAGGDWWTDILTNAGTIAPEGGGMAGQFSRRVGQSLGGAVIPIGATANTGRQAAGMIASALGGGTGAATAQQVAPGNATAEILAELAGGGIAGVSSLARGRNIAQREIEAAVPTVDQLKETAGGLYRSAEANGTVASPALTQQLSDTMRDTLRSEGRISPTGRISEVYPKAGEAIKLVDDYAGNAMNPTQMQTVRSVVADGMTSQDASERRIASMLVDSFDNWSTPLAPELGEARNVASRYLNAQKLEQARELAGARAGQFSGSGYENALRTEYRGLDRNTIKGRTRFNDPIVEAIESVSRGTPGSNAARSLGRLAPTTPMNFTMGSAIPAAVGTMIGGPVGGVAATVGTNALGVAGRKMATDMGIRNAEIAELIARNGGAIDQAPLVDDAAKRMIAALLAGQQSQYLEQ